MTLFTKLTFLTPTFRNPRAGCKGVNFPPTAQNFSYGSAVRTGPLGVHLLHRLSGKIEFDETGSFLKTDCKGLDSKNWDHNVREPRLPVACMSEACRNSCGDCLGIPFATDLHM